MCLTKIPAYGIFKLLSFIYLKKNVHCDMRFLNVKIGTLFCFLNGSGIAVPVFIFRNIQLGHQLYNHCTRLWPTKCYKII